MFARGRALLILETIFDAPALQMISTVAKLTNGSSVEGNTETWRTAEQKK
jgi:hypothetical protein